METNLKQATPAEIDAELFPLWADRWHQAGLASEYRNQIAATVWQTAYTEAYGTKAARRGINQYQLNQWNDALRRAEAKLAEINAAIEPLDAEFDRRGGWFRYVLVGNRNGHIHRNSCSTLKLTTRCLLLAQGSGMACTHCFPEAPVAPAPVVDPSACTGTTMTDYRYVNRYVNGGTFATCDACGQVVKAKQNGQPFKHKASN